MLKISLYYNFCIGLFVIKTTTNNYGKNKSYTIDRPATSATRRRLSVAACVHCAHGGAQTLNLVNKPPMFGIRHMGMPAEGSISP